MKINKETKTFISNDVLIIALNLSMDCLNRALPSLNGGLHEIFIEQSLLGTLKL